MSSESHQHFLEEQARRAAAKAKQKAEGKALTIAEVRHLKIQTVEPWKRVLLFAIGSVLGGLAIAAFAEGIVWLGIVLVVVALAFISVATTGRRKEIDVALDVVDLGDVLSGIVDLLT